MDIDPRMVTTPIGAAIGVVVARKLLNKKDQTFKNLAIGGGIGGGAGFLAGQYIKGEPGDISSPEGYRRYVETQLPTGTPSRQEIEALDNMSGGLYDIPAEGGNPFQVFQRNLAGEIAPYHNAVQGYRGRAGVLREKANDPKISESGRRTLLRVAQANEAAAERMRTSKMYETAKSTPIAAFQTVGELAGNSMSNLMKTKQLILRLLR